VIVIRSVEPEKWYLAVDCAKCGKPIVFAGAPSPEEKPDPIKYRKISDLKCPHCDHVDSYAPALMSRRQGPKKPLRAKTNPALQSRSVSKGTPNGET
jgi:DNA-directed RNA polymerase subunit RPC12/RpoP